MIDAIKVKDLITKRKNMHPDDPRISDIWDEITNILGRSIKDTVIFFNNCTEDEVYWLSEVFDDIAYELNSQEFIDCIEGLERKYEALNIRQDIEFAKKMLKF